MHHDSQSGHSLNGTNSKSTSPKAAFAACLSSLNLPHGLLSSVLHSYNSCDSRLWLLDNSSSMRVRDSHVRRSAKDGASIIEGLDNVTRWEELQECVAFHAKMTSRCWIPTKYWLVNDEGPHKKFSLCWSAKEDVPSEMNQIRHVMNDVTLDQSQCPLAARLHNLARGIAKEAPALRARKRHATLVICTQGLPTDKHGVTSSSVRREFQQELVAFGNLPVKVIVRLCTDDEKVRDMFNTMDSRFNAVDVLDDYWGEAMEVYLHNPWLTYGFGLHRLREAGLAPDIINDLDERPLTLDELYDFCKMLFVGEDEELVRLPHPKQSWNNFCRALAVLMDKEKAQWNPIKKCPTPWIRLSKLESKYGQHAHRRNSQHREEQARRSSSYHPQDAPPQHQQQGQRRSSQTSKRRSSQTSHNPQPPDERSLTAPGATKDLSLEEVLKRWSHQPSDYKTSYPLGHLLVTVPQKLFPPTNTKVEPHEYFGKWKEIDKEAFVDESGDELKELLKRATRKAKFFLHPDKLPKDLTENQTLLLKTIWDVLRDQEEATLG